MYVCVIKSGIKSECCHHITIQLTRLNFNILQHLSTPNFQWSSWSTERLNSLSICNRISNTQYLDEKIDSPISQLVVPQQCTAACTVRHSVDHHTRSISPVIRFYEYETAFTHSYIWRSENRTHERARFTSHDPDQSRTWYLTVKHMDREMKKILAS